MVRAAERAQHAAHVSTPVRGDTDQDGQSGEAAEGQEEYGTHQDGAGREAQGGERADGGAGQRVEEDERREAGEGGTDQEAREQATRTTQTDP